MPRISGPELRPDWIGTGSTGRGAGVPGWQAGSVASGPMVRSEVPKGWSSMVGFVPAMRQRGCPLGGGAFSVFIESQRCLFGAAGTGGGRFGAAWLSSSPSRPVRFRLAHPVGGVWRFRGLRGGWIGLVADQIVIPGAVERRPGIRARLKETGFPPSRE